MDMTQNGSSKSTKKQSRGARTLGLQLTLIFTINQCSYYFLNLFTYVQIPFLIIRYSYQCDPGVSVLAPK